MKKDFLGLFLMAAYDYGPTDFSPLYPFCPGCTGDSKVIVNRDKQQGGKRVQRQRIAGALVPQPPAEQQQHCGAGSDAGEAQLDRYDRALGGVFE